MLGFVHVETNQFADSSTSKNGEYWGGLSDLGRKLVVQRNELGTDQPLTVRHASDKAVLEMMTLSKSLKLSCLTQGQRLFSIIQEMLTIKYY